MQRFLVSSGDQRLNVDSEKLEFVSDIKKKLQDLRMVIIAIINSYRKKVVARFSQLFCFLESDSVFHCHIGFPD